MNKLSVTLIQTPLHWEDKDANLQMFDKLFSTNELGDLVVLPEMFTTGFTMDARKHGEPMDGPTLTWLKRNAQQHKTCITGSYIVEENGSYFNRMLLVRPDGSYDQYDKRHLFRMAKEHESFSGGKQKSISEIKGWKICLQVCYDLRFPVWTRNVNQAYDCLIYVANWPAPRKTAWNDLLKARAHENQCYVVGVNRTATDGNDIPYTGNSTVIDPKGNYLLEPLIEESAVKTIKLDYKELQQFREKFPVHLDADKFTIQE